MRICRWAWVASVCALFILGVESTWAGIVLYDDFSSGYLDGTKWMQRTYVREIADGQFVSKLGNRSPGMGAEIAPGVFRNHLPFANAESVSAIEAEVTVDEAVLDSVPDSKSGAMILGYFYNINESGGATGDIFAYLMIGKVKNVSDELVAYWAVFEVLSDDTTSKKLLGSGTISGFDPSVMNPPYKASVSYDGNRTLQFSVGSYNDSFVGPERRRDAQEQWKCLSTGIDAENSANDGYVSARFDNVYVNHELTPYDDFSNPLIDLSKWEYDEWVREASAGYLRTNKIAYQNSDIVNTVLTQADAAYFEAKVRIDSGTRLSTGAAVAGRLQGYFYNDSRGPGSGEEYNGYEGDVFVQVQLRYSSDGTLSARAYVDRSDFPDQSDFTTLFTHTFTQPIALDTFYALSIRFAGKRMIFGCNGETAEYDITTPIYPAYGEHRTLRARAYLDEGETANAKIHFDDVYTDQPVPLMPAVPLLLLEE